MSKKFPPIEVSISIFRPQFEQEAVHNNNIFFWYKSLDFSATSVVPVTPSFGKSRSCISVLVLDGCVKLQLWMNQPVPFCDVEKPFKISRLLQFSSYYRQIWALFVLGDHEFLTSAYVSLTPSVHISSNHKFGDRFRSLTVSRANGLLMQESLYYVGF